MERSAQKSPAPMVFPRFENFFTAMAEGGATLLGLLFVAVSIRNRTGRARGELSQELSEAVVLADATLYALADGFVISAAALLPQVNVAFVALTMSALSLLWAIHSAVHLKWAWEANASREVWTQRIRVLAHHLGGLIIEVGQIDAAVRLLIHPGDEKAVGLLADVVLSYYSLALLRAWVLVGGAHHGPRAMLGRLRSPDGAPSTR
jgi:hypothetical protein